MSKAIITEIHSIAAAPGWYFDEPGVDPMHWRPVACFALVSVFDPDFPSLAPSKQIAALSEDMIAQDVIGQDMADWHPIIYDKAFKAR